MLAGHWLGAGRGPGWLVRCPASWHSLAKTDLTPQETTTGSPSHQVPEDPGTAAVCCLHHLAAALQLYLSPQKVPVHTPKANYTLQDYHQFFQDIGLKTAGPCGRTRRG